MPSYTIKVHDNDEGEDLGTYEADYLPRVGDRVSLMHPRVCPDRGHPFLGVVTAVDHDAYAGDERNGKGTVATTVWLVEEYVAPTLYCDCTEEERAKWSVGEDGLCESCGHVRRT